MAKTANKPAPLRTTSDLTAEWLSAVLQKPVQSLQQTVLGVGESSMNVRASYADENGAQQSVVVKLASAKELSRLHALESVGPSR